MCPAPHDTEGDCFKGQLGKWYQKGIVPIFRLVWDALSCRPHVIQAPLG